MAGLIVRVCGPAPVDLRPTIIRPRTAANALHALICLVICALSRRWMGTPPQPVGHNAQRGNQFHSDRRQSMGPPAGGPSRSSSPAWRVSHFFTLCQGQERPAGSVGRGQHSRPPCLSPPSRYGHSRRGRIGMAAAGFTPGARITSARAVGASRWAGASGACSNRQYSVPPVDRHCAR